MKIPTVEQIIKTLPQTTMQHASGAVSSYTDVSVYTTSCIMYCVYNKYLTKLTGINNYN